MAGLAAASLAPLLLRLAPRHGDWLLALLPLGLTAYFLRLASRVRADDAAVAEASWVGVLDIDLSLRADALAIAFCLLVTAIGALVVVYAGAYLREAAGRGGFQAWLLLFMTSMLGIALADNLILLSVFWELTTVASFMLIGFEHEKSATRSSARQALLVTTAGGLAMLAGFILLGTAAGTFRISELLAGPARAELQASPTYPAILVLVLLGAFTKSAQLPFHFWLPGAMAAPTPVSAYLHSATMVKAGVFVLARFSPVLGGTAPWTFALTAAGVATMLVGAFLTLAQSDLKLVLAYSTISVLGLLTWLIGIGDDAAIRAAVVFFLAHALYKGALFLVVGAVDHATGTRELPRLGGLRRRMPVTATAAALAAASMAGLLPFVGFVGKELVYTAALRTGLLGVLAAVGAGISYVYAGWVTGIVPFWRRPAEPAPTRHHVREAPFGLWLGTGVLAMAGLAFGLRPDPLAGDLVRSASAAVQPDIAPWVLSTWHGVHLELVLGLVTIAVGVGIGIAHARVRARVLQWTPRRGLDDAFEAALGAVQRFATIQTRLLQSGHLRSYILIVLSFTIGLMAVVLVTRARFPWPAPEIGFTFYGPVVTTLTLVSIIAAVLFKPRMAAVAAVGGAGYGVALIFLVYGAPDLAIAQFVVEALILVLLVLAFRRLPYRDLRRSPRSRVLDGTVALATGGLVTLLVLMAAGLHAPSRISGYFADTAVPLARGENLVNLILVDYRAFDTLGEITVLGIAALGVYALFQSSHRARPTP